MCRWLTLTTAASSRSLRYSGPTSPRGIQPRTHSSEWLGAQGSWDYNSQKARGILLLLF